MEIPPSKYKRMNKEPTEDDPATPNPTQRRFTWKKLDLDSLCTFRQPIASETSHRDYLAYIRKIYPNGKSNLGVMFQGGIDETRALSVLRQVDYDGDAARFLTTFPTVSRMLRRKAVRPALGMGKLEGVFSKYVRLNRQEHCRNERTHFEAVLKGIDQGQVGLTFGELSDIIKEAQSNKYKVPNKVRRLFEESYNASREIQDLLDGTKSMQEVQDLKIKVKGLRVLPKNYSRLEEFCGKCLGFEFEVVSLLEKSSKGLKDLGLLINRLKTLGLATRQGEAVHRLRALWKRANEYLHEIQPLVSPYKTKSTHRKSDYTKAREMLEFFVMNGILGKKVEELRKLISSNERMVNTCRLYLNDSMVREEGFSEKIALRLEDSRFDMSALVERIRLKSQYIKKFKDLENYWWDHTKIDMNTKNIDKLKKMGLRFRRPQVLLYESYVAKIQRIR